LAFDDAQQGRIGLADKINGITVLAPQGLENFLNLLIVIEDQNINLPGLVHKLFITLNPENEFLNVFLILKNVGSKKHEFRQGRRNKSVRDGKTVDYFIFYYRQHFVDVVELSAY
jgi:hypothetical protein